MADLAYFAIVGVGRSGTTLLMSILNAHPHIAVPPEFHFVSQHLVRYPRAGLSKAMVRLQGDSRFARLGLDIEEVRRSFAKGSAPFSMILLYQEILALYAHRQNVGIIGDKAPKNIEYLPVLHRAFPRAKLIHLIRDPRDVYLSRSKAAWSAGRSDLSHFIAYRAQYEMSRCLGPELFGDCYLEVHYEDLISRPHVELGRVCRLLDVAFMDEMLDFSRSAKELVFADEMSWKKEVLGPLLTHNKEKWRQELTPEKAGRIEAACSPTFRDGFYRKSRRSRTSRAYLSERLTDAFMAVFSTIYQQSLAVKNRRVLRAISSPCFH